MHVNQQKKEVDRSRNKSTSLLKTTYCYNWLVFYELHSSLSLKLSFLINLNMKGGWVLFSLSLTHTLPRSFNAKVPETVSVWIWWQSTAEWFFIFCTFVCFLYNNSLIIAFLAIWWPLYNVRLKIQFRTKRKLIKSLKEIELKNYFFCIIWSTDLKLLSNKRRSQICCYRSH